MLLWGSQRLANRHLLSEYIVFLSSFHHYVFSDQTNAILLFASLSFLLILRFFFLQEDGTEQSVGELGNTFAVPLELVPPSPALKLPYMSPSSIGGFTHSKAALSGVTSMTSLDVLQEQEGLEGNGAFWNGGNDLTEGMIYPFRWDFS